MSHVDISSDTLVAMKSAAPFLYNSLNSLTRCRPQDYQAYFHEVEHASKINDTRATLRCHILANDGNNRPRVDGLAHKLREQLVDYSIPRSQIERAAQEYQKTKSASAFTALDKKAAGLFTDIANSGEGGEVLLYFLAEQVLRLPQIFCKMPLKTNTRMHVHGVDGIHAGVNTDGRLSLYWGESKLHGKMNDAIKNCFESIAPFLLEPEGEGAASLRDMQLLRDNLDLNNPELEKALMHYLDPDDLLYQKTEFRAICLVGFDHKDYIKLVNKNKLSDSAIETFEDCANKVQNAIRTHTIETFIIETFCIPFPSVDDFRQSFLKEMGLNNVP